MVDGFDGALFCLEELWVARDADVDGHLEVILLLTDERIIRHRDVETLVRVNAISQCGPETNHITKHSCKTEHSAVAPHFWGFLPLKIC